MFLAVAAVVSVAGNAAMAECGPEYFAEELACTTGAWNSQTCTCGGPSDITGTASGGDPCGGEIDVSACYALRMSQYQQNVTAAGYESAELKAWCQSVQVWARQSGYNVPYHACEY